MSGDLAEKPQGIRFVTPFLLRLGDLERARRVLPRLLDTASHERRFAPPANPERVTGEEFYGSGTLERLLKQGQGFRQAVCQGIGVGEKREQRRTWGDLHGPVNGHAAFKSGNRLVEIPLEQIEQATVLETHCPGFPDDQPPRRGGLRPE